MLRHLYFSDTDRAHGYRASTGEGGDRHSLKPCWRRSRMRVAEISNHGVSAQVNFPGGGDCAGARLHVRQMCVKPLLMLRRRAWSAGSPDGGRPADDCFPEWFRTGTSWERVSRESWPMINASGFAAPASARHSRSVCDVQEGGISTQFTLIQCEERLIGDSQLQHRFTLLAGCFWLRTVRRNIVGMMITRCKPIKFARISTGLRCP